MFFIKLTSYLFSAPMPFISLIIPFIASMLIFIQRIYRRLVVLEEGLIAKNERGIINFLLFGINVDVYDPYAKAENVNQEYNIKLIPSLSKKYQAIILAVSHEVFLELDFNELKEGANAVIFDIKSFLERSIVDGRL